MSRTTVLATAYSSQQYCTRTICLRGLGRIMANDCKELHATLGATRTLVNCLVVAAAAVDSTPASMITVVRQHQHQLTSSLTLVTTMLPHSTQKQISSLSSSSLSLSYFGQAFILLCFTPLRSWLIVYAFAKFCDETSVVCPLLLYDSVTETGTFPDQRL